MVVTMGAAGCVYFTPDLSGVVVRFGVDAIDATGAGDGFGAGLLHGLIADWDGRSEEARVRSICRTANAVGALATDRAWRDPGPADPGSGAPVPGRPSERLSMDLPRNAGKRARLDHRPDAHAQRERSDDRSDHPRRRLRSRGLRRHGDLARRKLLPALYYRDLDEQLAPEPRIIAVTRHARGNSTAVEAALRQHVPTVRSGHQRS